MQLSSNDQIHRRLCVALEQESSTQLQLVHFIQHLPVVIISTFSKVKVQALTQPRVDAFDLLIMHHFSLLCPGHGGLTVGR